MAKANASAPASVEDRRKQLEAQLKSLDKVGGIVAALKDFSPEAQREALQQAAISLNCVKARKPRTKKPKADAPPTAPGEVPAAV